MQVQRLCIGANGAASSLGAVASSALRAELELRLNALRNAAYARGYAAGKGELVARAEGRFS